MRGLRSTHISVRSICFSMYCIYKFILLDKDCYIGPNKIIFHSKTEA